MVVWESVCREREGQQVNRDDNAVEQQRVCKISPISCELLGRFEGGRKRPQDLLHIFVIPIQRDTVVVPQVAAIVRLQVSCDSVETV